MPPSVGKWLGIDTPMGGGTSSEDFNRQYQVVRPDWVKDRSPACQVAVDRHLD
jgi:hypothetical protein